MNLEEQINQNEADLFSPESMISALEDLNYSLNKVRSIDSDASLPEVASAVAMRKKLLTASDWMIMPDSALSDEEISALKIYRQALRDLPDSKGWLEKGTVDYLKMPEIPDFKYKATLKTILNEMAEVVELSGEDSLSPDMDKLVRLEESCEIDMNLEGGEPNPGLESAESEPKRARDESGKFMKDDPSTPDYNEAWEGGKAPKAESDPETPEE